MLQIGDYSAWVSVDGKPLTEYNTEISDDGKQATCWIPSEVGKNFKVEWIVSDRVRTATSGRVTIDGFQCDGKIVWCGGGKGARKDVSSGDHTRRDLVFSDLQLTDEEAYVDASHPERIGEIVLEMRKVQIIKRVSASARHRKTLPVSQTVHERAKKGGVHCLGFGEEVRVNSKALAETRELSPWPVATFLFKYRPIEMLRANGIAPLPKVSRKRKRPASSNHERDVKPKLDDAVKLDDDSDIEEARILEAKLQAVRERLAKKEKKPKIKTETSYKFVPGEIIDLT